jgi:hypothetical protein
MVTLWNDGRSGAAGCLAGNLVLADIRDRERERFAERKGTTFFGSASIWVGRVCSTDAYLSARDRHWANLALEQHREVMSEANVHGWSVRYLFITAQASAPSIHYWIVPGELVERIVFSDQKKFAADYVAAVHIRENERRYQLEGQDITSFHHVLDLNPNDASRLERAFESARQQRERRAKRRGLASPTVPTEWAGAVDDVTARSDSASTGPRLGRFEIPLKGGRCAVLSLPVPTGDADLSRIKGWIDLMSDVLTESESPAVQAVSLLQQQSEARGTDKLSPEEIDEEIKQVRRGRRR